MTDASDLSWSIVLTQSHNSERGKPVEERSHEPLYLFIYLFTFGHTLEHLALEVDDGG
jgi:hypothetical protein